VVERLRGVREPKMLTYEKPRLFGNREKDAPGTFAAMCSNTKPRIIGIVKHKLRGGVCRLGQFDGAAIQNAFLFVEVP
jgi:hypothetical protein